MLLTFNDGTQVDLEGQFGTAKRKLAEGSGISPDEITELKTADEKRIVIGPPNATWSRLVQE